jgi:hypothetical protein
MRKRDLRKWLWTAPLMLAGGAGAQDVPKSPTSPTNANAPVEAGGKVSVETIPMGDGRPTASLRYGSVKKGSESVDLDGRHLERDKEYAFDYAAGTVYLMVPVRPGSSLKVSYRYEEATGKAGTFAPGGQAPAFSGYTFNLVGGASAVVGLGFTERLGDGTVVNSNNYGLTNNFTLGKGSVLNGLFMMSDRAKSYGSSLMEGAGSAQVEEGQGRALIQNLSMPMLGGSMSFYYQDIDKRFAGFQSFGGAGYTQEQISQLEKEKGLKRSLFAMKDVGAGAFKLSYSDGKVGDDMGNISQKSQGLSFGPVSLTHRTQTVDSEFNRFGDVGAADWQWLQKERGLTRDAWSGAYQFGTGSSLSYNSFETSDESSAVRRESLALASKVFNLEYYRQEIDDNFSRFGDLRPEDWSGQSLLNPQFQNFGNERGLSRTGLGFNTTFIPGASLNYRQSSIEDSGGELQAVSGIFKRAGFFIEHSSIDVDKDFSRLGSIGADLPAYADQAVKMIDPSMALHGNDVQAFAGSAGLGRDLWRLGYDFGKAGKLGYQMHEISGANDELRASRLDYISPGFNFNYSDQKTGEGFTEIGALTQSERERYGVTPGLDKTDMSLNMKVGKGGTLEASSMNAEDPTGGAMRETLGFTSTNLKLSYTHRNIDGDFSAISTLVDPERDLLRALAGQDMTEFNLRWQMLPNLGLESKRMALENSAKGETGAFEESRANWSPFKDTKLEYFRWGQSRYTTTDAMVDQLQQQYILTQRFSFGTLTLMEHDFTYDGTEDTNPDAKTQAVSFDTQISKSTGFRTEHTETKFETGEKEVTTANTISTDLSNRVGVSVTDLHVNRDGDKPDEARQQYGFWYDFGKGIKLKYGYNRATKDEANGTLNRSAEVTGGEFQGVKIGGASYKEERVDDVRDQHLGGINISNARPLDFGFLDDVRFNYSSDTQRDYNMWRKENKRLGFGAAIGQVAFGYDYYSQVNVAEERAIDRFFTLNLDKTGKSPLQVGLRYGVRTLPSDESYMIRDYAITYKPNDKISFEHSVKTNLLKDQNNALLGSIITPDRTNLWALNYTADKNYTAGLYWKESINEQANLLRREGGIDILLFRNNPSPLRLQYGVEETDVAGRRTTAHRWGLTFNQQAGPNQSFNFMIENRAWEHDRTPEFDLQKWNMRLDFTVRF